MKREELIEALKMLGRGRIDAAELIADLLMPEDKTVSIKLPVLESPPKKKKAE